MKRLYAIGFLIFGLLSADVALSQSKPIEKTQYNEKVVKSINDLRGKTYRSTTIEEKFIEDNTKPIKSMTTVYEILPPDRNRWILVTETGKKEVITIGQKRYVRVNSGKWQDGESSRLSSGKRGVAAVESETYRLNENEKLNGEEVLLYEEIINSKSSSDGGENREIYTNKFWINKNGLLLKTQTDIEEISKEFITRTTTVYEYNPNIKIEAPIK
jgi:hypothetical protein